MKKHLSFIIWLFVMMAFVGCSKSEEFETDDNGQSQTPAVEQTDETFLGTTIQLDGVDAAQFYEGCTVNSIYDEAPVSNGTMKLKSNINEKVQTYFLTDGNDNIYMLSRVSNTQQNKRIEFTTESTAMAFVTLNPFFAQIDSVAYDVLEEAILQSQNFPAVRTEVNNVIKQKKDLYNQGNTALYEALGLLLDELIVFADYKPEAKSASRAITNETGYYPFRLNSSGNRLDFQVFGLNPNYYGTATHANGSVEKLVVQSHDDFGFLAGLESIWNILNNKGWDMNQYGDIESYTFPEDGECQFHFSCNTEENQIDLIARLFSSACDILGIDVDESTSDIYDMYNDLSTIVQEVNNASYKLGAATFPFFEITEEIAMDRLIGEATDLIEASIEQSYDGEIAVYEKLKKTTNDKNILNAYNNRIKGLEKSKKLFSNVMRNYTLVKTLGNAATRVIAACRATDPVDFKLCCYNDEIRNCSQIRKYKGDNQTGVYGVELETPISVMVNVNMESTNDYIVKFEVYQGGGSVGDSEKQEEYVEINSNVASIKWTLGMDSEEQIVRAYLCEKESKEEVCEPVEFMATATEADLPIHIENIEYEESPFYEDGIVTFEPTITVTTDTPEELEYLYEWGLILYEDSTEIDRFPISPNRKSYEFSYEFELDRDEMDIDYNSLIAKNNQKYSIGTYIMYHATGEQIESDVVTPIELVYDRKPAIRFLDAQVTALYRDPNRKVVNCFEYKFTVEINGVLFFKQDENLEYMDDGIENPLLGTINTPNFYLKDEDTLESNSGFTYPDNIDSYLNKPDYEYFRVMLGNGTYLYSENKLATVRTGYPDGYVYISD